MPNDTEKLIYVRPLLRKDVRMAKARAPGSSIGGESTERVSDQGREVLFELRGRAAEGDTRALDSLIEFGLLAASLLKKLSRKQRNIVGPIAELYAVWPIRGSIIKGDMEKKALELRDLGVGRRASYRSSPQITFKTPFSVIARMIIVSIDLNRELLRDRSQHRLIREKMDKLRAKIPGFYCEVAPHAMPACLQMISHLPLEPTTKQLWEAGKALFQDTYPDFDKLPELAAQAVHLKDKRGERRSALMKQIKQAFFSLVGSKHQNENMA